MATKRSTPTRPLRVHDVSLAVDVTTYSARVYPRPSTVPNNYAGADMGFMILTSGTTPNLPQFNIHFLPDGTNFPPPSFDQAKNTIQMYMSWSQYQPLLQLLQTATHVQALYSETGGVAWADVEGQFARSK